MHSPQAPGGVRATGEDLVPEPSDEVEEAGKRGGAAQDGQQHQLDQQQRAWEAGGGLHDQGRISLQRAEQVLVEARRAKGHHDARARAAQQQDFYNNTNNNNGACCRPSLQYDRKQQQCILII